MDKIDLILSILSDFSLFFFIMACVKLLAMPEVKLRIVGTAAGTVVFIAYSVFFHTLASEFNLWLGLIFCAGFFILLVIIPFIAVKQPFIRCLYISTFALFVSNFLYDIGRNLLYSIDPDQKIYRGIVLIMLILLFAGLPVLLNLYKTRIQAAMSLLPKSIYVLVLLDIFLLGILSAVLEEDEYVVGFEYAKGIVANVLMVILSLLSALSIAIMIMSSIGKKYYRSINSVLEEQINKQIEYYDKTQVLTDDIRRFRHDYRNHMICIRSMLKSNETQQAADYIENLTEKFSVENKQFATGNKIADAVLAYKAGNESGTVIDFSGYIPDNIDSVDLCIILSNALDNAIEACGKLQDADKRQVTVLSDLRQGYFTLSFINPVKENISIPHSGILPTTKGDPLLHGFGMSSIKRLTEKYDGRMNVVCSDGEFILNVILKMS